MDTTTAVGEEIMFQDKGNPQEEIGIKMGLAQYPVGALARTRNHAGKFPYRDPLPVQPVLYDGTNMHNIKSVELSYSHNMGFW